MLFKIVDRGSDQSFISWSLRTAKKRNFRCWIERWRINPYHLFIHKSDERSPSQITCMSKYYPFWPKRMMQPLRFVCFCQSLDNILMFVTTTRFPDRLNYLDSDFGLCLSTWKVHLPNEIQKHSLFNGRSKTDCSFESSKHWGVFGSQNSCLTGSSMVQDGKGRQFGR